MWRWRYFQISVRTCNAPPRKLGITSVPILRSWGIALGQGDRHLRRRGGSFICSYARLGECNNCIIMSGTSLRMFAFAPSLNNAQWGCIFGNPRNGLKAERTTVKLHMILWCPWTTANIYLFHLDITFGSMTPFIDCKQAGTELLQQFHSSCVFRHYTLVSIWLQCFSPVVLFVGVEDVLVLGPWDEFALWAGPNLSRSGPWVGGPLVTLETRLNYCSEENLKHIFLQSFAQVGWSFELVHALFYFHPAEVLLIKIQQTWMFEVYLLMRASAKCDLFGKLLWA